MSCKKHKLFRISLILTVISFLISCAANEQSAYVSENILQEKNTKRDKDTFLAYEHSINVEAPTLKIKLAYQNTVELCNTSTEFNCTLLNANFSTGSHLTSTMRFRLEPHGVRKLTQIAAEAGSITNQSVNIEDLAKSVLESEKRIKMLNIYRTRLLDIQDKATNDIDSLMKIASELAKTQSQIEESSGEKIYLKQRIEQDILTIKFFTIKDRSFWGAITSSLSDVPDSFAEGLSDTVVEVSYLIPWFIIIVFMFVLFRWLWRKTSSK
ncbi:MAG: DUF4349 domain-containing protein [Proteobacteria bacterium]|nr:DUF4349 domain-containing protein [Pseudomonadota bacterium]